MKISHIRSNGGGGGRSLLVCGILVALAVVAFTLAPGHAQTPPPPDRIPGETAINQNLVPPGTTLTAQAGPGSVTLTWQHSGNSGCGRREFGILDPPPCTHNIYVWKHGETSVRTIQVDYPGGRERYDLNRSRTYVVRGLEGGQLYWFAVRWNTVQDSPSFGHVGRGNPIVGATPLAPQSASAGVVDPTVRSWPLTEIADEAPTEWWFPIGRGTCDMKDEIRPWTWKNWKPPTADKCGWISIPDVRADLEEPVDELAFKVYTALISSPDIDGRARVGRPSGPSVKLAVWAVYPRPYDGRMVNSTRRLKGPYESAITVCLPGSEGQAIHGYDPQEGKWRVLEAVEAEHEGHICGSHRHDLGLLVVGREPSP